MDEKEVFVSPWDLGFLRGYGVFEYISVYDSSPFMADAHLARLENSAKEVDLRLPLTKERIKEITFSLIEENNLVDGAIRIILTGGESADAISSKNEPSLLIRTEGPSRASKELYKEGGKLIVREYLRELPRAKTTQYIEALRLQKEMSEVGAIEVLYTFDEVVLECSRSNIFIVKNGTLITPEKNILKGITRQVVLEEAQVKKIPTEEREVRVDEIISADEIFITGTGKKVLPIRMVNEQNISSGQPGELTKEIISLYESRIRP